MREWASGHVFVDCGNLRARGADSRSLDPLAQVGGGYTPARVLETAAPEMYKIAVMAETGTLDANASALNLSFVTYKTG